MTSRSSYLWLTAAVYHVNGRGGCGPLTCVWTGLVQQLHHALPLHGGPASDGGAAPDAAVLLLDLGRTALGDERTQLTAESRKKQTTLKTPDQDKMAYSVF